MGNKRNIGLLALVVTIAIMGLSIIFNWGCTAPFSWPLTLLTIAVVGGSAWAILTDEE